MNREGEVEGRGGRREEGKGEQGVGRGRRVNEEGEEEGAPGPTPAPEYQFTEGSRSRPTLIALSPRRRRVSPAGVFGSVPRGGRRGLARRLRKRVRRRKCLADGRFGLIIGLFILPFADWRHFSLASAAN